jgi:toxin ParE1/3/4
VAREVLFAPEAEEDMLSLYNYIAARSGTTRARDYAERIISHCRGFAIFPERGTRRDDLRPGLRITGFERRVTIAFHLTEEVVIIDRILYGGRDVSAAFETEA